MCFVWTLSNEFYSAPLFEKQGTISCTTPQGYVASKCKQANLGLCQGARWWWRDLSNSLAFSRKGLWAATHALSHWGSAEIDRRCLPVLCSSVDMFDTGFVKKIEWFARALTMTNFWTERTGICQNSLFESVLIQSCRKVTPCHGENCTGTTTKALCHYARMITLNYTTYPLTLKQSENGTVCHSSSWIKTIDNPKHFKTFELPNVAADWNPTSGCLLFP